MTSLPFEKSHYAVNDSRCWFHQIPLEQAEAIWDHGFALTASMGVHWDRVLLPGVFNWNVVERTKGVYDWTYPDTLVRAAQRHRINLLPVVWPFASWDQAAWANTGRKLVDHSLWWARRTSGRSTPAPRVMPIGSRSATGPQSGPTRSVWWRSLGGTSSSMSPSFGLP